MNYSVVFLYSNLGWYLINILGCGAWWLIELDVVAYFTGWGVVAL